MIYLGIDANWADFNFIISLELRDPAQEWGGESQVTHSSSQSSVTSPPLLISGGM